MYAIRSYYELPRIGHSEATSQWSSEPSTQAVSAIGPSSAWMISHDTHELIFFQTGMGTTIINGIPYSYNPNSICLTRANDVRDHICEKHTHYICIRFKSTHQISKVSSGVYCSQASKLNTLFKEIENEFLHKNYFYFELCNRNNFV